MYKGIIALDIDGTITVEKHHLDQKVSCYLNHLIENEWLLIFITGRTFSFAKPILSAFKQTYFLAVQNGAALFEMPNERLVQKTYLPTTILPHLEVKRLIVESGKELGDVCYYRPQYLTSTELDYIEIKKEFSPEKWIPVSDFNELKIKEFAVGKYFAAEAEAYAIADRVKKNEGLNVIVIRNPFAHGHYLAHINAHNASKGHILESFRKMHGIQYPIIAAGDDLNDVEMLEKSTFKIVMQNAPHQMHVLADLIAHEAANHGIIDALKEATEHYERDH